MKRLQRARAILVALAPLALAAMPCAATAQQAFQLSSKFTEASFIGETKWNGTHKFGNVLCLTFPNSTDAQSLAEAFYNNHTLYFSRAAYRDLTAIYVVASMVPAGRSSEEETKRLFDQNQKGVDAYPANFRQTMADGALGASIKLTVLNSLEGPKDQPFPFTRRIGVRPDGKLTSLSIHRIFVHQRDRIELAGLKYFQPPIEPEGQEQAIAELTAMVEKAADSLQTCTAALPTRTQ